MQPEQVIATGNPVSQTVPAASQSTCVAPSDPATIRLPLSTPVASSYLFLAYPLAILATQSWDQRWLLERFVELYFVPERGLKVHTHAACTSALMHRVYDADFPGMRQQRVDPRRQSGCPLAALRGHLRDGIYPQVDVDMNRLHPGSRGGPWLHEILICGTDQTRFEVYAFKGDGLLRGGWQLRQWWIEEADLLAALQIDGPALLDAARSRGEDLPRWLIKDWSARPLWILHQFTTEQRPDGTRGNNGVSDPVIEDADDPRARPDASTVLDQLALYLGNDRPARAGIDELPVDTHWGHAAQLALAMTIRQSGHIPVICLRLWWEHKRVMAQRVRWLANLNDAQSAHKRVVEQMAELAREAGRLRLIALRHSRSTRSSPDRCHETGPEQVASGIERVAETERLLLRQILRRLR